MSWHRTVRLNLGARLVGVSLAGGLFLLPGLCCARDVAVLAVTPGRSADVVIEHGAPFTLEVGETVEGVKLLQADGSSAVLSVNGVTRRVPVTTRPGDDGGGSPSVTLSADARGQFFTSGTINGHAVRFVVDTGATVTSLSRAEARRIGLDYRGGRPARSATVNGVVKGWLVALDTVRVGNLTERSVDAMVVDNDSLPVVLLGTNFLNRFTMHREGSTLVLRRHR
jgi:aspartyl protease family protein